jgi:kynurenine 3-monooxygenase
MRCAPAAVADGGARVALVGDAAHVLPPLGVSGCDVACEDCAELARCIDAARGPAGISVALREYALRRRTEIDAATELANRAFAALLGGGQGLLLTPTVCVAYCVVGGRGVSVWQRLMC